MLFLTPRNSNAPVVVPTNITQKLCQIDISGVRHIYEQCFIKGNNCVLNHDKEMNLPRQIHALLTAVKPCKPSLIVCQRTSLSKWCYELSVGLNIIVAPEITENIKLSNIDAVLVPHDQLRLIKSTSIDEWSLFVVDDIELVIQSRFIKNVNVDFRIAITERHFLIHPDDELQWNILKWTNPALVENKDLFIQSNKFNKRNLLRPFPEFWQRLSWALFDSSKPTIANIEAYEAQVEDWCKLNIPTALILSNVKARNSRRSDSKRKINKNAVAESKRRRVVSKKKCIKQENIKENSYTKETDRTNENNDSKDIILSAKINRKHTDINIAFDSSEEDVPHNAKTIRFSSPALSENTSNTSRVLRTQTAKAKTYNFMSDEEDPILNSLFMEDVPTSQHTTSKTIDSSDTEEYPVEETVLKHAEIAVSPTTIKDDVSCQSPNIQFDANLILDSLVDSPQPAVNVGNTEMSDDENTNAILDLLL